MNSTDQTRRELLAALSELSRLRPEWRLGQTLANMAMTAGRLDAGGVWDLEDDEALSAARTLIEHYSQIGSEAAQQTGAERGRPASPAPHDGVSGVPAGDLRP